MRTGSRWTKVCEGGADCVTRSALEECDIGKVLARFEEYRWNEREKLPPPVAVEYLRRENISGKELDRFLEHLRLAKINHEHLLLIAPQ